MPDDGPQEAQVPAPLAWRKRLWRRLRDHPRWVQRDPGTGRGAVVLTLERTVLLLAVAFSAMGLAGGIAALFGGFRIVAALVTVAWLAAIVLGLTLLARRRIRVLFDAFDWGAIGVAAAMALSAGLRHHIDFVSTYDTGIYLQDAIVMSKTGSRTLPGLWVNWLPGFVGNAQAGFHVQATFGYAAFAAYFSYWFGWAATWWANGPLTFTTTLCLFVLGRRLGARWGAIGTIVLYGTSLLTVWFNRWTMTENAAAMVFWAGVVLALPLSRRWDHTRGAGLFVCLLYGMLVRPEGFLVAGWFAFLLAVFQRKAILAAVRRLRAQRGLGGRWVPVGIVLAMVAGVGGLLAFVIQNRRHQIEYGMGLLGILLQGRPLSDGADVRTVGPHPNWGDYAFRYEWDSAFQYLIQVFFLIGIIGIWRRAIPRRAALTIAAFALVYLMYVVMPPVTIYHPWFMRRLWVAFIPLSYLLAATTLDPQLIQRILGQRTKQGRAKRRSVVAAGIVLLLFFTFFHLQASARFIPTRENDGVALAADQIAGDLGPDPFVVLDPSTRLYSGALRLVHDVPTHNLHFRSRESTVSLFTEADKAGSLYVLRNSAADGKTSDLDAPSESQMEVRTYASTWTWFGRDQENYRGYMGNPPLKNGYAPFQYQIQHRVPPPFMIQLNPVLDVVRVAAPLVLNRHCSFDPASWDLTALGLEAMADDARVNVTPAKVPEGPRGKYAYFVYPQVANASWEILAEGIDGEHVPMGTLRSDGSGRLRYAELRFPQDMETQALLFPDGAVMRGIFVGGPPRDEPQPRT